MSAKAYLPMWTAGMFSCCQNTIRTCASVEREGYQTRCSVCSAPLQVRQGAWEVVTLDAARIDPHNTRIGTRETRT